MSARGRRRPALSGLSVLARRSMERRIADELRRERAEPLTEAQLSVLLIPAWIAAARLRVGEAEEFDVYALLAFLNIAICLSAGINEDEACALLQEAMFDLVAVHQRGGPRYALNAAQRSTILAATLTGDELYHVCTRGEFRAAVAKTDLLPKTDDLQTVMMEI